MSQALANVVQGAAARMHSLAVSIREASMSKEGRQASEMQDAENRIENKRNLNEQHPKRCIMLQFLTVRAQRAHLLLRVYCERSEQ